MNYKITYLRFVVFSLTLILLGGCSGDDSTAQPDSYFMKAVIQYRNGDIPYFGNNGNGFLRVRKSTVGETTSLKFSARDAASEIVIQVVLADFKELGTHPFYVQDDNKFVASFTIREIGYYPSDGNPQFEVTSVSDNTIEGTFSGDIFHGANLELTKSIQNGSFSLPFSNF